MTSRNFCFWLRGFIDNQDEMEGMSGKEVDSIQCQLDLVVDGNQLIGEQIIKGLKLKEFKIDCADDQPSTPRYYKDHGESLTIGDIINDLKEIPDTNEFRDKIDETFFNGAWPGEERGSFISETFKRDIAGLLFAAIHPS